MLVRKCPRCNSERPATEFLCQGEVAGAICNWDLTNEPRTYPGVGPVNPNTASQSSVSRVCRNGHRYDEGDIICAECGVPIEEADSGEEPEKLTSATELPGQWQLEGILTKSGEVRERYLVTHVDHKQKCVLTLYRDGAEPDLDVQNVLRNMDIDHTPKLVEAGRFRGRCYEVFEYIEGGCLDDIKLSINDRELLRRIVDEIGRALDDFAQVGLRHRDLRPSTVLIRSLENLDLVIDGFGSARLSDFDLDVESPLEITRYMAPEAIAGGVAAASDWWSLGMMLLEKLTNGACFEGVHEQAFLINVLANGVPLPEDLDPDVDLLLRGLLARDRELRWQWREVEAWLRGEYVEAPDAGWREELDAGPPIILGGVTFHSLSRYALAASEERNWDEACTQFSQGLLLNWLGELQFHRRGLSELRSVRGSALELDDKFSIALKILNPDLPLIRRGEIISPAWLIENPIEGYRLISGEAPELLDDLGAERWLAQLKRREARVREVAKYHEVELNEERLQILLVATSVAQFKAQWEAKRRLLPDTDHHGLATLMERRQIAEEDLIILCAAEIGQFRSIQELVEEASELADRFGAGAFDVDRAQKLLMSSSKGEILRDVEERIRDFATCSIDELDKWADQFRIEGRISLTKALVLHSIPEDLWSKPPRHAYVRQLISFFEQKLSLSIRQGPLSRMTIAKTSAKIDLIELNTPSQPAEALLNRLLKRSEYLTTLDPQPFIQDPLLERRLRNLERQATLYRRDTGIDGLYMGFPFLLLQLPNKNTKPRIAPILLWPVKIVAEVGQQGQLRLAFDKDREEVRFNPAIESYVGSDAFKRWIESAKTLLGRSVSAKDVIDEFGRLATPRSRDLGKLPGLNAKVPNGKGELASAAVLFHVKFIGQAIVEDLRQLKDQRIEGSALEPMLRLTEASQEASHPAKVHELEKFAVVDSDPSQDKAVLDARNQPGLVISGPPGTGKSQTIVNIIADAIGRDKSLLVVCQKQAALEVVHKRLEADGLGNRVVMVTDENKDRKPVVKLVREQVEGLLRDGLGSTRVERKRLEIAAQIEELESELDAQHLAMHKVDDISGLSYRDLIAQLVKLEEGSRPAIDCLDLRAVLAPLGKELVARARERCSALSKVWLEAQYENSPLSVLKDFNWDSATINAFTTDFLKFSKAEAARRQSLLNRASPIRLEKTEVARAWLNEACDEFKRATDHTLVTLGKWIDLFDGTELKESRAAWCLGGLSRIKKDLSDLGPSISDPNMHSVTAQLSAREFRKILRRCRNTTNPQGVFGKLKVVRSFRQWTLGRWLERNQLERDEAGIQSYADFLEIESKIKPLRTMYYKVQRTLRIDKEVRQVLTREELLTAVSQGILLVNLIRPLAALVLSCPLKERAIQFAKLSPPTSIRDYLLDLEVACDQADARANSLNLLKELAKWINGEWMTARHAHIQNDSSDVSEVASIYSALSTVAAFQQFRVRSKVLTSDEWAIFGALRKSEAALEKIPEQDLAAELRRTIDREQRLLWKANLEKRYPEVLADREEIESKVESLAAADVQMRMLNRQILANGVNIARIADPKRWEDITRLTGVRMKRLREFMRLGIDLGLTSVRPIWLMNPEVVSRVLPLARGIFDVVVFDEASQMPVEHAIPALYRASLAVVSGDEKQLPPTSFFSSKVESDEAEFSEADMPEEGATEEEIEALEEVWDRREIKNCPDLLALANSTLPSTLLEIHYRSHYRELIAFSNHSFYAGRLHVPARHPQEKILQVKPIQVIRVDGLYQHQVNLDEALKVVKVAEHLWSRPRINRPTIGVVTFNRKQADLIQEQMEAHAEKNPTFRKAYAEENERFVDGEDMRFFVKNVENVQGDERDIMIFSTTFGRNRQGTFRRTFGVLGQKGGERRLNVAVTRAKRKVVIITSMPVSEISDFLASRRKSSSPRDYLQAYLYYAEQLSSGQLNVAASLLGRLNSASNGDAKRRSASDDGFSDTVATYIERKLNLHVVPSNDGTAFGIDYAIQNPKTGLFGIGIECDSPNHALLKQARPREIWRRQVLSQSIRKIHRVSSYGWYHDRVNEQEMLRQAITEAIS